MLCFRWMTFWDKLRLIRQLIFTMFFHNQIKDAIMHRTSVRFLDSVLYTPSANQVCCVYLWQWFESFFLFVNLPNRFNPVFIVCLMSFSRFAHVGVKVTCFKKIRSFLNTESKVIMKTTFTCSMCVAWIFINSCFAVIKLTVGTR